MSERKAGEEKNEGNKCDSKGDRGGGEREHSYVKRKKEFIMMTPYTFSTDMILLVVLLWCS